MKMKIVKKHAIKLAEKNVVEKQSDEAIFLFQMNQPTLCMDFERFHKATEKILDRPVWTHEFAHPELLFREYIKKLEG